MLRRCRPPRSARPASSPSSSPRGAAKARDIAIAASTEFGVPLFDLDSHQRRSRHRQAGPGQAAARSTACLPLYPARQAPVPRRSRIRPTCTPSTRSSSRPASASKPWSSKTTSCRRPSTRPSSRPTRRCRTSATTRGFDLESLEVSGGDDELEGDEVIARRRRRRAHRALRQQADARCHPPRRLGHPLRAVRKDLPRALPHGRRAEGNRAAARAARRQAVGAPQGHVAPRHRRAPRAAGRPHQDEAVEELAPSTSA